MTADVHVDFRKYPDTVHWHYTMRRLAEDEHGLWIWAPAGTETRRGTEPPTAASSVFLKLLNDTAWHSAIWNEGGKFEVYVDINTPPRWHGDTVTMIDLDLDVVKYRDDGRVAILDEDEFAEHQRSLDYPPQLIDGARAAAAAVYVALESNQEPFATVGKSHLAKAVELAANL